jgi:hypothetical protein
VADFTLSSAKDGEVVVELEAGDTVFTSGAHYETGLVIKDLVTGATIPATPAPVSGGMDTAPWTTRSESFVYTISAADLAAHAGNLCQIYTYLLVGKHHFDASFAESPLFLILP